MKEIVDLLEERRAASRRRFLTTAGLVGAAAVGSTLVAKTARGAGAVYTDPKKHTASETDILNFALNLEYLEAEFYLRAVSGTGLADSDVTGIDSTAPGKKPKGSVTAGVVTGPTTAKVTFTNSTVAQVAADIASDELAHVLFLRGALGKAAVARPTIDLNASFTAAAIAAGIISAGQTFDPFANDDTFLLAAFIFEDVGVTAYHGAAAYISNKTVLSAAAGILATEAYHGGAIRALLGYRGQNLPMPLDISVANQISALRASADGSGNGGNEAPLTDSSGNLIIAANDANGIAFARTLNEVLNIVYLGGTAGVGGGFFPSGLNGAIS